MQFLNFGLRQRGRNVENDNERERSQGVMEDNARGGTTQHVCGNQMQFKEFGE